MNFTKWFRVYYNKITESIAFYPAIIAIGFLLLSVIMLKIDFSPWGKHMKTGLSWLSLKDASTARSIISTVAGAIISLAVFSFSMVMIVLNQAASQMSNRVLTSMIENRFQQVILGVYIGTIVYALFLLSTIRDIDSGVYIPALSIYLLILLTVIDIFLFIYFLDYVTQTVKYETVIHRVQKQTMATMKEKFEDIGEENVSWSSMPFVEIRSAESNYFQGFNEKKLLKIAREKNLYICFLYKQATYLIKGVVFMKVYGTGLVDDECKHDLLSATDFFKGQPIDRNADYGFIQLAEVAIKALSPGINDPGTAVISLHSLSDIFAYKLYHNLPSVWLDHEGVKRIYIPCSSFDDMFEKCIRPIWNYGKNDEYIQKELTLMVKQLITADHKKLYTEAFDKLMKEIEKQKEI
ncbi:MAG: DUF2254 domain-containing protein [Bacteroidota bacterium]|nr:DUF2254 domain-containing protein [Bacteroidota bacterium]